MYMENPWWVRVRVGDEDILDSKSPDGVIQHHNNDNLVIKNVQESADSIINKDEDHVWRLAENLGVSRADAERIIQTM